MSVEEAHMYFEALLPPETFYAAHLNIIRHGREVCHARNPNVSAVSCAETAITIKQYKIQIGRPASK